MHGDDRTSRDRTPAGRGSGSWQCAPETVLILGGGTAGWSAATYLSVVRPDTSITLVESDSIGTVGVGESTNPITRRFNDACGIDERQFMREADATFKVGIRFDGFRDGHDTFFHPFDRPINPVWCNPDAQESYLTTHLCRNRRFDARLTRYGYHVDASRMVDVLRRTAERNGVRRIQKTVRSVRREGNRIVDVDGLRADLYIDSSGYHRMLARSDFVSLDRRLFNDAAVVFDGTSDPLTIPPYTRCVASGAGWIWEIPLRSRCSFGYCYSSRYATAAEAESVLVEHLGERQRLGSPKHLRFRHGRLRVPWVGNCVAIGLAFGFIEPLESTGLALTQQSIIDLAEHLDDRDGYNRRTCGLFDTTVDFIQAHYALSTRSDSDYWKDITRTASRNHRLTGLLRRARRGDYGFVNDDPHAFYRSGDWNVVLAGMGLFGAPTGQTAEVDVSNVADHEEYVGAFMRPG